MLIKYRDMEVVDDHSFIKAVHHDNPVEVIKLLKQVDHMVLNDNWYRMGWTEYMPATEEGVIDVLNVYLEEII